MKHPEKIYKLANNFEFKIKRFAIESDSTEATLIIRPTVNNTLVSLKFNDAVQKSVQNIINKIGEDFHGSLIVDTFVTNAKMSGGKWVVDPGTSGLRVKGTLATDPTIQSLMRKFNTSLISTLTAALNKATANKILRGETITNHETGVNEININM